MATIFDQYLQPPKTVTDFSNDIENATARRNQNALQSLALQQQTAATQQSLGERNALQRIAAQSGGDRNALISGLRNSGLPGLMTQADSLEQSGAKLSESQSVAGKNNIETDQKSYDLRVQKANKAVSDIAALNSSEDAVASLKQHLASGDIDMAKATAVMKTIPQDPAQFPAWRKSMLMNILDAKTQLEMSKPVLGSTNLGGTEQYTARDPLTGAVTVNGNQARTVSPDTVATTETTKRGQNITAGTAAQRLAFDRENANQGVTYQTDDNGQVIALPTKLAPGNPAPTGRVAVGANGQPIAGKSNLTETQGKATTFAARMQDASKTIDSLESKGVSGSDLRTIAAGSGYTNWLASSEGQQYRQAQENWITANLRQESGAAIGVDEMTKDVRKFFPVPGDDKAVISQKQQARKVAEQGMIAQAGPGARQVSGIIQRAGGGNEAANVVRTPDGRVHTFPNAQAAASFKKAAGL